MSYYMQFSSFSSIHMEKQRKIQNVISNLKKKYSYTNNTIHINDKNISIDISAHDNYCVIVSKNGIKKQHYLMFLNDKTIEELDI